MRYLQENNEIKKELERTEEIIDRINELYEKTGMDKLVEEVKESENFKVYDLYGFAYDEDIDVDIIDMYLYGQWEIFQEEFLDNGFELHQIGRTSSNYISAGFYTRELIKREDYKPFKSERLNVVDLLQEIIIGTHLYGIDSIYDVDGKVDYTLMEDCLGWLHSDDETENLEAIIENLQEINNLVLLDIVDTLESDSSLKEEMRDFREIKDYIKSFKEHQVEDFKEWLELTEILTLDN